MDRKDLSRREQKCIADCIFKHWSEHSKTKPEHRDDAYEQCLTDCQICR